MSWVGETAVLLPFEGEIESITKSQIVENELETFTVQDQVLVGIFLTPGTEYTISFTEPGSQSIGFTTLPWADGRPPSELPIPQILGYVSEDYPLEILMCIYHAFPGDYLITIAQSASFWVTLLRLGLFALDSEEGLVTIPNPVEKFCFDLTKTISWNVKEKYIPEFEFVVSSEISELAETLGLCSQWHSTHKNTGSWLTHTCIVNLCRMAQGIPEFQFLVFKLVEKKSGEIASVSLGYKLGDNFMDYTACTPIRDKRSAGKLLLKLECDYLRSQGVKLWYLGYNLDYMASLSPDSVLLDRHTFTNLWISNY